MLVYVSEAVVRRCSVKKVFLRILTGKKHCQIKLQLLQKVQIWAFGFLVQQINSLWEVLKLKQNFRKNKVVTGKHSVLCLGLFYRHHSICLNIGFWYGSFVWQWCVLNLVLSTKNWCSSFLKKVFVFQKICFKAKVLKTFKIFTDCHIKTCLSVKRRTILKIPSTVF